MFVCGTGCDILQPDITWCGGITEARRIYALASAYDIPCIPHGSSVYSYHLQFANAQSPLAELLIMSKKEKGWWWWWWDFGDMVLEGCWKDVGGDCTLVDVMAMLVNVGGCCTLYCSTFEWYTLLRAF